MRDLIVSLFVLAARPGLRPAAAAQPPAGPAGVGPRRAGGPNLLFAFRPE